MASVQELTPALGVVAACKAMGVPRCTPGRVQRRLDRANFVGPLQRHRTRRRSHLALDDGENERILEALNSERFADVAPAAVHAV